MRTQVYGHTYPTADEGSTGFASAFIEDDGTFSLSVRQHKGGQQGEFIVLPGDEGVKLAEAILAADKQRKKDEAAAKKGQASPKLDPPPVEAG